MVEFGSNPDNVRLAIMKGECIVGSPEEISNKAREKIRKAYFDIIEVYKYYMDIPEKEIKIIAVWLIGTYMHETFNTYPYLFFNAMRGSGKTRCLKLISTLGANGDGSIQNNVTEAVLFRIPRGTVTCIDEVEQIGAKEKQTLRELLNSAYKKGMKVKRMKKKKENNEEKQVVEVFEPYFPIAMANINGVEEVLGDRSIVLVLEKSDNPCVTMKIEDFDTNPQIQQIKSSLKFINDVSDVTLRKKNIYTDWNNYINSKFISSSSSLSSSIVITSSSLLDSDTLEFFDKISSLGIAGRNFELLYPLLTTAKLIGNDVFDEILRIGSEVVNKKKEDEYTDSKDVSLIEFVATKVDLGMQMISLKGFTNEFRTYVGETDQFEDKWLNEKWMTRALKRLNLIIYKKKISSGMQVMLNQTKAIEKLKMFKVDN